MSQIDKVKLVYDRKTIINMILMSFFGGITTLITLLVNQVRELGAPTVGGTLFLLVLCSLAVSFFLLRYYYYNNIKLETVKPTETVEAVI